jgi:malate synthase
VFDAELPTPNQIERIPGDVITRDDLLAIPEGDRTLRGLEHNVRVGLRYIEAWLRGVGCVPIDNLMEDAATAEISRSQIWQWLQHGAEVQGVGRLTLAEVTTRIHEAARTLGDTATGPHRFADAAALFLQGATHAPLEEFLTLNAYEALVREGH